MISRRMLFVGALLFTLLLSGCFSSAKPMRYYTVVLPDTEAQVQNPYPARLLVKKATIDPAYRRNNIVYRESPFDFMFYNYSAWATRPEYLMEQAVTSRMNQSGLFQHVENTPTAKPDYEMLIHVISVEEIDYDGAHDAHLAMDISLRKVDGEMDLWAKRFDGRKPFDGGDKRDFAAAVSALLDTFTQETLVGVRNVLDQGTQK